MILRLVIYKSSIKTCKDSLKKSCKVRHSPARAQVQPVQVGLRMGRARRRSGDVWQCRRLAPHNRESHSCGTTLQNVPTNNDWRPHHVENNRIGGGARPEGEGKPREGCGEEKRRVTTTGLARVVQIRLGIHQILSNAK